eukprot:11868018-Alexandrium_andersonii.AAC.1
MIKAHLPMRHRAVLTHRCRTLRPVIHFVREDGQAALAKAVAPRLAPREPLHPVRILLSAFNAHAHAAPDKEETDVER